MKKTLYTIAFMLAALSTQAQTPIKETREEVADVVLFGSDLLLTTKKDKDGQYIYVEKRHGGAGMEKEPVLNAGHTNAIIGKNTATGELFVYHKRGRRRKTERLAVYVWEQGSFTKTEERRIPRRMNHSYNLGLFLTEDKSTLYISAEYRPSRGYEDIYLSRWKNNRWTRPENLGKKVNTRLPEFAPFVANDSLFFSRKEKNAAYVYAIPLKEQAAPEGEALKLKDNVNKEEAFNAYYKKSDEGELWITAATDVKAEEPQLTAFISEKPVVEPAPVAAPVKEVIAREEVAAPVATAPAVAEVEKSASGFELTYAFNEVFLSPAQVKELQHYLARQPQGAKLTITGCSDASGTEKAKQRVGYKRAAYVKWYIDKYYRSKGFSTQTEYVVAKERSPENRKIVIGKAD